MPVALLLADPEILVAALLAVLVLFGVMILGTVLSSMIPKVGIPGISWVVRNFQAGVSTIVGRLEDYLVSAIGPAVTGIGVLVHMFRGMYQAINHALGSAYNTLAIAIEHWIPGIYNYLIASIEAAYGKAIAYVHTVYAFLIASIEAAYGKAIAYVHAVYGFLVASIESAYGKAIAYTHAVYGFLVASIESAYGKAVAFAQAVQAWAAATIATGLASVEGYALNLYRLAQAEIADAYAKSVAYAAAIAEHWAHEAVATVEAEAVAAGTAVWGGIATDVDALAHELADDFADVRSAVGSIPRAIPGDLASTIAGVAALSVPLLRLAKDCVVPNCRNLGGLGHELADLLSEASTAGLLAMLVEMADAPERFAADATTALGGIVDGAVTAGRDLLRVA